jgi:hypothetical protein
MQALSVVLVVCSLGAVTGKGVLLLGSSVHFMSSQVELLAIGDELAARGHKVSTYSCFFAIWVTFLYLFNFIHS